MTTDLRGYTLNKTIDSLWLRYFCVLFTRFMHHNANYAGVLNTRVDVRLTIRRRNACIAYTCHTDRQFFLDHCVIIIYALCFESFIVYTIVALLIINSAEVIRCERLNKKNYIYYLLLICTINKQYANIIIIC